MLADQRVNTYQPGCLPFDFLPQADVTQGQALTFVRKGATRRELEPSWEHAQVFPPLPSYCDGILVLQLFLPDQTLDSKVLNYYQRFYLKTHLQPFVHILYHWLKLYLVIKPFSVPNTHLHGPFPKISMYPTTTDFYLTLFPLHTQKYLLSAHSSFNYPHFLSFI